MSTQPCRVAVAGSAGRMGSLAVQAVRDQSDMELVAEIRRDTDAALVLESARADVLVDLSIADAARRLLPVAVRLGISPVIGVTGLTSAELDDIGEMSLRRGLGAIYAPNFAIGAVLMMRFAQEAARHMGSAEIIEMHHERKLDAPSGTALRTAEMIAGIRQSDSPAHHGTLPSRGLSAPGDVHIHSVRMPGFIASQEVIFGGPGQRLSIRHDSIDRSSFMPGVLLAIRRVRSLSGLVQGLENLL